MPRDDERVSDYATPEQNGKPTGLDGLCERAVGLLSFHRYEVIE